MSQVSVVGSEYCDSEMVELAVARKVIPEPDGTIFVLAKDHNTVFNTVDTSSAFHMKRLLLDASGIPILTFRQKRRSLHHRWRVYKGKSEDDEDLIYTAKQSSMVGSNRELNVFLATNKHEKTCDFKVGTSSVEFYVGDSRTNIMAQTRDCKVRVYPSVDRAFIVSLIVIQDAINQKRRETRQTLNSTMEYVIGL